MSLCVLCFRSCSIIEKKNHWKSAETSKKIIYKRLNKSKMRAEWLTQLGWLDCNLMCTCHFLKTVFNVPQMHFLLWINHLLNITRYWEWRMPRSQHSEYQSTVIIANVPENVLFNRVSSLFTCFYQRCYQNPTRFREKIRLRDSSWGQAVIDYSWYTVFVQD